MKKLLAILATLATLFALRVPLFAPIARAAGTFTTADTTVTIANVALKIMAGSQYDSLQTSATNLTVTVAADEAFIIRSPGPTPYALENDGGLAACNVLTNRDNQLIVYGPKTVAITPSTSPCSTANYSTNTTPFLTINQPNGGETLKAGDSYQVFWQSTGRVTGSVRLRLSTDGGASYPTTVTTGLINNGFYQWTVPTVTTTSQARLRLEGFDQGRIEAFDMSNADFTIEGTAPPVEPPQPAQKQYDPYIPATATTTAATIGADKGLAAATADKQLCHPDSRIKVRGLDTVYYCGADGKRYVFPNRKTHDTWYTDNFAGVIELDLAAVQRIPLGGNVTYRPGVRMVKVTTSPEVFTLDADGTLRYVSEAAAIRLYGADWNTKIDDIPDAFWVNYKLGTPILE
jgi:hypothetical protein